MNNFSNLKAKKSLGQNFLKSKKALSDMLEAGEVGKNDIVLEAGPGKGVLTEELLKKAGKVIAVEKDDILVELLREKFSDEIARGKLELINGDILNFNPTTFFSSSSYNLKPKTYHLQTSPHNPQPATGNLPLTTSNLKPKTYKLIANIPYYITGQFLRKFLSGENQPSKMVILLQKEVVKRITANDGKESILSISVKAYGRPKNIGKVSKENFSPKPKVDSAILLIDNISHDFFKKADDFELRKSATCHSRAGRRQMSPIISATGNPDQTTESLDPRIREDDRGDRNDRTESIAIKNDEEKFFKIVKAGFAHKRKFLAGNIRHLAKNTENIEKILENCKIPPKARAEDIKLEQWKCLAIKL